MTIIINAFVVFFFSVGVAGTVVKQLGVVQENIFRKIEGLKTSFNKALAQINNTSKEEVENIKTDIQAMVQEYENLLKLKEDRLTELEKLNKVYEKALNLQREQRLEEFDTNTSTDTNNVVNGNMSEIG